MFLICHACDLQVVPPVNALRELATRQKSAVKSAGDTKWNPFLAVELKRFLPSGFQEHCVTLLELEEDKQPKAAQRRLEVCNACDMHVAREGCALALH